MNVRFEFIGGDTIAAVLKSYSAGIDAQIEASIGRSVLMLQRYVVANKLSGQVLGKRTGNLRRSINQVVERNGTKTVGMVKTNVRYGVAHEYGFSGAVSVKAHLRQIKQAFGRPLRESRSVQIKAHSRHVKLPERSFLRSALRDLQPQIEADLQMAVERALR
ncbi:hypothetical protein [Bergeriella denitrificans]|uniref:Putative phage associated protein n=1 Tax=Bergeriella denitrificans TaxID=494 RepID=A0A378UJ01_BERDE|nr:hypothetical protein [Bergeriella denitrificans]STZ77348.1 putative phage associated protein [Bergeriella denitrificans]